MTQRAAPLGTPPAAPLNDAPASPFAVEGDARELLGLCARNLLLQGVTLGLYHGWARTRVRRYLWCHTAFAGEPFRYTGRGAELLAGYGLLGAAGVLLLGLPAALLLLGGGWASAALVWVLAACPLLAFAAGCASYCARRYLLSCTQWRDARFGLAGRARDHGALTVLYGLLTLITGGLFLPLMRNRMAAHLIGNAWVGGERFRYDGQEDVLLHRFLLASALMLLAVVAWAVLVGATAPFAVRYLRGATLGGTPVLLPVALGLGVALLLPAPGAAWLWYRAGELRHFVGHTRLGDARFALALPSGRYVWLRLSNTAALLGSLGLAYPWVTLRTARVLAAALRMDGVLALDALSAQAELEAGGPPG